MSRARMPEGKTLFTKPAVGRLNPSRKRVAAAPGATTCRSLRDVTREAQRQRQWREVLG